MLHCPDFLTRAIVAWKVLTKDQPERQGLGLDVLALVGQEYVHSPVYNQLLTIQERDRTIAGLQQKLLSEREAAFLLGKKVKPPVPNSSIPTKRELRTSLHDYTQSELARCKLLLIESENPARFQKDNLHAVQTLLRRRISAIEITEPSHRISTMQAAAALTH